MSIEPFKLERYFAQYEFSAPYLLSSSDCEALPMRELLETADDETRAMWDSLRLGYTESQGHPILREEIAKLYEGIDKDDVLVVTPEEGIFVAMQSLLQKGDRVVTTYPGYQSLYEIAKSIGCEVDHWTPQEENGWWFDPDELEAKLSPHTKLLVMNFPHNPTGALPSKGDMERVMAMAKEKGIRVFSDEMYRFLEFEPADRLPSAAETDEQAIALCGMSKTFSLPGLRLGWLVSRDREALQKMQAYKDYTTICASAPSEILALMGLRAKEITVTNNILRIRRNLAELDQFFTEYSSIASWVRPRAGSVCFPKLELAEPASSFCKRAVDDAGIMILPSTVYDYDDHHIRIGFGRDNLPEVLEKLKDFVRKDSSSHHGSVKR